MEPDIRLATPEEHPAVRRCYDRNGYRGPIEDAHVVLVAVVAGDVVAAVRLVAEHGHLTLRGFFMNENLRRKGLGTRMLEALVPHMGERECWLVCFADLPPFYARAGFEPVADEDAPAYLGERASAYRREYGPQVILHRPGRR